MPKGKLLKVKPKNERFIIVSDVIRARTINAGQPMGLLLALTYPTSITVNL